MNRRSFLRHANASALACAADGCWHGAQAGTLADLVPSGPGPAPNYWCSWGVQMGMADWKRPDSRVMNAEDLTRVVEDYINEDTVFGPDGWAGAYFPAIRRDLYFMLDGGWSTTYQSFIADPKKFPSFTDERGAAIGKLNAAVKARGWRGAALWCRDTPGGALDERIMDDLASGGIGYVKIDVGDAGFHLLDLRDKAKLAVVLEHVSGVDGGLNGDPSKDGRYPALASDSVQARVLRRTDVYRIYDLQGPFQVPTALDRVTQSIKVVEGDPAARAIINAEAMASMAAVLGCSLGIMHHPRLVPSEDAPALDEVVRAVRWQRIAPPYAAGRGFLRLSAERLTDEWVYPEDNASDGTKAGSAARQSAPARVARNLELPEVRCDRDPPYVLAGKFPGGAIAVGTLPRVLPGRPAFTSPASVTVDVDGATGAVGVFGAFEALTLVGRIFPANARVLAQDLAGDRAIDISREVKISPDRMTVPGDVIARVGRSAASSGDPSAPGLLLTVT